MYIYVAEGEFFMVQWERGGNTSSALHLGWHNPSPYCGMKNSPCTTDISNQSVSLSLQVWHVLIIFDLGFQQTVHCNEIKCYIFMAIRPIKRAHWGWVVVMDPHLHGPLHTPWEADKDSWHTWQSMIQALASIYNFISIVPIFLDSSTQNNEKKSKKKFFEWELVEWTLICRDLYQHRCKWGPPANNDCKNQPISAVRLAGGFPGNVVQDSYLQCVISGDTSLALSHQMTVHLIHVSF